MKRETKIGILFIVCLGLFIWGFQYLKGRDILSRSQTFYIKYDQVDFLKESNPVLVSGYQVGTVRSVYQNPDNKREIMVELDVRKDVRVPKDTKARIISTNLMGGKAVVLDFDKSCEGDQCAASGDYLEGESVGFLNSMVGQENVKSYVQILEDAVDRIMEKLSSGATGEDSELAKSVEDVQAILTNLRSTTTRLDRVMANSSASIESSLKNVAAITDNLQESNEQIKSILGNVDTITGQLREANVGETVESATTTIDGLQNTLAGVDAAVADLGIVLDKIKQSEGTLGLLVNDRELHDNLNVTLQNLELLLQDIRLHPKRYFRVLSKKEKPYVKPEDDPGFN